MNKMNPQYITELKTELERHKKQLEYLVEKRKKWETAEPGLKGRLQIKLEDINWQCGFIKGYAKAILDLEHNFRR